MLCARNLFLFTGLFLYALTPVRGEATTFLWWNIGGANFLETFNPRIRYQPTDLGKNLLLILDENLPEVIVLGEYFPGFLKPEILQKIRSRLPFSRRFRNSNLSPMGMIVFSKRRLQYRYHYEKLRWTDGPLAEKSDLDHRGYLRSFLKLEIRTEDGRTVQLAPVHTAQPWNEMKEDSVGLSRFNGGLGLGTLPGEIETAWAIFYRLDHALGYQAKIFAKYIHHYQRPERSSPRDIWMVMGDLNVFDSYLVSPPALKIIQGNLNEGRNSGELNYSFPVPRTYDSKFKVRIDHVFSSLPSSQLTYQYLDCRGSDHYPLLIKF